MLNIDEQIYNNYERQNDIEYMKETNMLLNEISKNVNDVCKKININLKKLFNIAK